METPSIAESPASGTWKYELLLAGVIAARATSFIFSKMVLAHMNTFNLMSLRFLIAFALLLVFFHRRLRQITKHEALSGAVIGTLFVLVMASELTALKTTASSTVSLLENCSIIFVPLFESILLRRLPERTAALSAVTAMAGVACLSAQTGTLSRGMLLALLAAALYAVAILVTAKVSHSTVDPLRVGIVQVGTIGILALAASFLFETPHLPGSGAQWLMIFALAVVCTGFGFTLQPVAQSHVSAERAGLFCAISPVIAAILGSAVLHEHFDLLNAAGLLLILFSIALPYLRLGRRGPHTHGDART